MKIDLRLVSPLGKVFHDGAPVGGYIRATALRGETVSLQAAWKIDGATKVPLRLSVACDAPTRARRVRSVPVVFATYPDADTDYLRREPCLIPDALEEVPSDGVTGFSFKWESAWIDIENAEAGHHDIEISLTSPDGQCARQVFSLDIIDAELPEMDIAHTKWFHCDGICQFYGVEMWSERFWEICENFVAAMPKRGINTLLTPIHTPPLDTAIGGERLTCQLVDVYAGNSGYGFGFEKLERWVAMAQRCGIKYFEMAHLFTQWGAKAAPKIIVDVAGEKMRLFGWDTPAMGTLYRDFLRSYLPALCAELRKLGIADRCFFHISDEPSAADIESYTDARRFVSEYLEGFTVIDALSDYEFYAGGVVEHPVPAIDHMDAFVENRVPGLWTYYCCGQYRDVPNMFMAMPSYRNRILGILMYKYSLAGFLQWGYNFYNSQYSTHPVDPWVSTDGDGFVPAGDTFQVYPGRDGRPVESIRMMVTLHAMQDMMALKLLERLAGREFTMSLVEARGPVTFSDYPRSEKYIEDLRERVNQEISARISR